MSSPLYEQLFRHVLDEIKAGRLSVGDRVPSEKELAEQFNVSRITSKKALEKLMQLGVIERARGKGSFVAKNLPDLTKLSANGKIPAETENPPENGDHPVIGVILEGFAASYGMKMLQGIEERCADAGCFFFMRRTNARRDLEERAIEEFLQMGVEGLIIYPVHDNYYNNQILRLVLDKFPLVLVDRYLRGIPASAVYTDNREAALELTNYLLGLGHRELAFISPPTENTSALEERAQGFQDALSRRNIKPLASHLFTDIYSTLPNMSSAEATQSDMQKLQEFIVANPQITAFVACEYDIAHMLRRVLNRLGKAVPQDVSIVCFDSPDEPSSLEQPSFTHVQQNEFFIGRTAVDLLLAQIRGEGAPLHTIADFAIIKGRSTAAPLLAKVRELSV